MRTRFGQFILEPETRRLLRDGQEIHLSPKAFDLLCALALERPNVIAKPVLQQRLWPDTFVAEANLSNLVAEVREALGDDARTPRFIRTVHRRGYAFCGETEAALLAHDQAVEGATQDDDEKSRIASLRENFLRNVGPGK